MWIWSVEEWIETGWTGQLFSVNQHCAGPLIDTSQRPLIPGVTSEAFTQGLGHYNGLLLTFRQDFYCYMSQITQLPQSGTCRIPCLRVLQLCQDLHVQMIQNHLYDLMYQLNIAEWNLLLIKSFTWWLKKQISNLISCCVCPDTQSTFSSSLSSLSLPFDFLISAQNFCFWAYQATREPLM